ncbi:hypothetical protein [Thiothrix fructosivorans]|uniref:Uncharacterized protein n=1 Tax=Thiothrix fructosivorans TaxID=111770 RepID=A0A8B0SGS9_9GAMM|nr:hypothetical protein [Thiothrix fructosivorans]MBO0613990.1 hypothetical protein [Thiothrix fructosivorans]QTX10351.1 hypothetical protein J1836_017485 [Thiothrix fructosivorans]
MLTLYYPHFIKKSMRDIPASSAALPEELPSSNRFKVGGGDVLMAGKGAVWRGRAYKPAGKPSTRWMNSVYISHIIRL